MPRAMLASTPVFSGALLSLLLVVVPLASPVAAAHPGGQDECHCHTNRKTGEYHCHSGVLAGQSFDGKAQMLAMLRTKRLDPQKVCKAGK